MTELTLYDTKTREKRAFQPIDPADVRMYVCGPTVYDRAHIGNARPVVVFDVLYRLLRHVYGADHVTYVRNVTDIDDKINARARETRAEGESVMDAVRRITAETTGWYRDDMAALGALPPDHEPRATEHVDGMIRMTETLIAKGHAYEAEGHVLFDVSSFDAYGALSNRPLEQMEAGARVEVAPYKRNPADFVLWKPSDESLPGWESPWGRGRPGWHIECSVMAKAYLGERFDIHAGGVDLVFPHHENELAQSCCANGTDRMANFWLHNGFLQVEGEKMSKSLGNFFTVADLRERLPGEVIRLVLLSTQYRSPLDWTEQTVQDAFRRLLRWRRLVSEPREGNVPPQVLEALADDLNTPQALAEIDALIDAGDKRGARAALWLMNLAAPDLSDFFGEAAAETVEKLIAERRRARSARDFGRADRLRDALTEAGVILKDRPDGTDWEFGADFDAGKLEAIE